MKVGASAGLLVVLSGCDVLFQLGDVHGAPPDAAPDVGCGAPDEDGDCIADDVDNCPGIYNPSQASDRDTDGIGDICDPRPTTNGDIRREFFGFNDAADQAAWPYHGSGWVFGDGYVEQTNAADTYAFIEQGAVSSEADLAVEAGFTFGAWNPSASASFLGVWLDLPDPSNYDGHSCFVSLYGDTSAHDTLFLQEAVFGTGGNSKGTSIPALQPGDEVVISLRRHRSPDVLQCFAIINGTRYDVTDVTGTVTWTSGGHVGVSGNSANERVRYVVTYVGQ